MTRFLLVACLSVGGCAWITTGTTDDTENATLRYPSEAELEADAAIVPRDDYGDFPKPDDPAARARSLRKRFPGVHTVDLVKIVAASGRRSGSCFSFMEPATTAEIEASWRTRESEQTVDVQAAPALLENGWIWVYQAPQGEGFELRESLEELHFTYRNALRCICRDGARRLESEPVPVVLRIQWEKDAMPGVSAARVNGGDQRGLIPRVTTGGLVVYDFPLEGRFPTETRARCEARVSVSLLVDPPIL